MPRRSNHANFYASPIWITESGGAFDPPHRRSDPRRRNCPHRAAPDGPDCVGDHDRSPRRDHGGCRFRQLRSKSSHQKVPRPHFVETGGSRTSFGPASSWPNPVDENVLFEVLCPSDSAGSGRQPRRRRHTAASKGSRGVVYFPRPGRTVPKAPFRDRSFTSRTGALLPCLVRASPSLDTFIHARPPFSGSTGATASSSIPRSVLVRLARCPCRVVLITAKQNLQIEEQGPTNSARRMNNGPGLLFFYRLVQIPGQSFGSLPRSYGAGYSGAPIRRLEYKLRGYRQKEMFSYGRI